MPDAPPSAAALPPTDTPFYDGDRYVVAESVGFLLHKLMTNIRRDIESRMVHHDLTAAQWQPLWLLKTGRASSAQEMARELNVDAGAITRMLDRLEAKGLLGRCRSETDRRVVHLKLSAEGEAAVAQVPYVMAAVNNQYLSGFSAADHDQLKGLLRRMLANAESA